MADFSFVTDRLATGGAVNCVADVQALVARGITHVIDCRAEFDDAPLLAGAGLAYLWNGTPDDGTVKPPEWFTHSLDFALQALVHPRNRVYAHCAAGINRGPSTAYAILRALGLSALTAEGMVRIARPIVGLRYKHDADVAITTLGY